MGDVNTAALPLAHVLFRSSRQRDRGLYVPPDHRRRGHRRETSVIRLAAHLAMTSCVFLMLASLVWLVSLTFHFMHRLFPFSAEAFELLNRLEILLAYVDAAVSGVVLLNGIWNYLIEVIRGDS